jgi:hypothetical protein
MRTPEDVLCTIPMADHRLTELVRSCLAHPRGARLLHWLYARPTTAMTETDIASLLLMSAADTRAALDRLNAGGFPRHVSVGSLVFYGLTQDVQIRALLGQFKGWCATNTDSLWRGEAWWSN